MRGAVAFEDEYIPELRTESFLPVDCGGPARYAVIEVGLCPANQGGTAANIALELFMAQGRFLLELLNTYTMKGILT